MKDYEIQLINSSQASNFCREITATLPEWFAIPKANERYAEGMLKRIALAAFSQDECVGMLTLEFPYPDNANIYWMAIKKNYHNQNIGTRLIHSAEYYCQKQNCTSLTVETVSPKQSDKNYTNTYHFYIKNQFKPLFEMYTYGPDNLMVYMQKTIINNFNEKNTKLFADKLIQGDEVRVIAPSIMELVNLIERCNHLFSK